MDKKQIDSSSIEYEFNFFKKNNEYPRKDSASLKFKKYFAYSCMVFYSVLMFSIVYSAFPGHQNPSYVVVAHQNNTDWRVVDYDIPIDKVKIEDQILTKNIKQQNSINELAKSDELMKNNYVKTLKEEIKESNLSDIHKKNLNGLLVEGQKIKEQLLEIQKESDVLIKNNANKEQKIPF